MYRIDSGANFCHVSRISPDDRGMPCATSGTQKWNGARPSFIAMAKVIMIDDNGLCRFMTVHWPECNKLIIMASMRSIDAVA